MSRAEGTKSDHPGTKRKNEESPFCSALWFYHQLHTTTSFPNSSTPVSLYVQARIRGGEQEEEREGEEIRVRRKKGKEREKERRRKRELQDEEEERRRTRISSEDRVCVCVCGDKSLSLSLSLSLYLPRIESDWEKGSHCHDCKEKVWKRQ